MSVASRLLKFYEQPRGKVLKTLGLFIAAPLRELYLQDTERFTKRAGDADIMRGRLELLLNVLRRDK
jgi:hypothetical protein